MVTVLMLPSDAFAFKPKTHLYLALQSIAQIDACKITIEGVTYDVDIEICNAIRQNKSDYLGGVLGPDAFPDIHFGQTYIHPDRRCWYDTNPSGDCSDGADTSWSLDWMKHLWDRAREQTGPGRSRAIAFAVGFITHGAGDMWAHTFVNRFAGGSWPDVLDAANADIVLRHVVVEGVIGNHTPDIRARISALGGLTAPTDFIHSALINHPWARARSSGSMVGMFHELRDYLQEQRGEEPSVLDFAAIFLGDPTAPVRVGKYYYTGCWIKEIDKGLRAWPEVSLGIASALFVDENTLAVWNPHLKNFKQNHMVWMLGNPTKPMDLLARCTGAPQTLIDALNLLADPGGALRDALGEISVFNPLQLIFDSFKDFMFLSNTGKTYDQFMDYMENPETHINSALFPTGTSATVTGLLNLGPTGAFSDTSFAAAANTILLGRLALLNSQGLDDLLLTYNVGKVYTNTGYGEVDKKIHVMLGFIRSLDGNHQWRDHAPSLPVTEPERRFGEGQGMPLYKDCLARRNFFRKVFSDWMHDGVDTVYYDEGEEQCVQISNLPPVSVTVETFGEGVHKLGAGSFWSPGCNPVGLRILLSNHQTNAQEYAILVTDDLAPPLLIKQLLHYPLLPSTLRLCSSESPPAGRLFHRVVTGNLPAIPPRGPNPPGHAKEERVLLPCLGPGLFHYRVYVLEKLISTKLPVLGNNPRIEPNVPEYLTVPVGFVDISLMVGEQTKPPLCAASTPPACAAGAKTWHVPRNNGWKYDSVGICESCTAVDCDADRDSVFNQSDNCPMTANSDQRDSNSDRTGDACTLLPDLKPVLTEWTRGILPDPRFLDVIKKYPFLFELPKVAEGLGPMPTWASKFSITSNHFKGYTRSYLAGKVPEHRYLANMRAVIRGATYDADGVRVVGGDVRLTSQAQTIRLRLNAKSGGRIRLNLPRLIVDGTDGQATKSTFAVRATGAKPGRISESVTAVDRVLDLQINPGTTEVVLERRP